MGSLSNWIILLLLCIASITTFYFISPRTRKKKSSKRSSSKSSKVKAAAQASSSSSAGKPKPIPRQKVSNKRLKWPSSSSSQAKKREQNRDMTVSLFTNWEATKECEIFGYYLNTQQQWSYLNKKNSNSAETNERDDLLLDYLTSLRSYSPLCELYQSIGNDLVAKKKSHRKGDFLVLYQEDAIVGIYSNLEELPNVLDLTAESNSTFDSLLLSEETLFDPSTGKIIEKPTSSYVYILYSDFTTSSSSASSFQTFYSHLKQSQSIPFCVRYYSQSIKIQPKMYLQGYGVRLDVRNLEYRAFDDASSTIASSPSSISSTSDEAIDASAFLAGVNLTQIQTRHSQLSLNNEDSLLQSLQTKHAKIMNEIKVLPHAYQRRRVSLQTTQILLQESDSLLGLQQISQNFPSYANLLSMTEFSLENKSIMEYSKLLARLQGVLSRSSDVPFGFYINGRRISVERPSFNVFELVHVLEEEMSLINFIQSTFKDISVSTEVLETMLLGGLNNEEDQEQDQEDDDDDDDIMGGGAGVPSKNIRIDVGRTKPFTNPIFYINNIERDSIYSTYTPSLQTLLFGSIRVRRNLFHVLLTIDPFQVTNDDVQLIDLLQHLVVEQGFPIRVGLLFYDHQQNNNSDKDSVQVYEMLNLFQMVLEQYDTMTLLSLLEYWIQFIHLQSKEENSSLTHETIWETVKIHLEKLLPSHKLSKISKIKQSFFDKHDSKQQLQKLTDYNENMKAFIQSKYITPDIIFFNGIPLSKADSEFEALFNQLIQEEIHLLMNNFMKGFITEQKPRSLYSFLLTSRKNHVVYKFYHEILTQSSIQDKIYIDFKDTYKNSGLNIITEETAMDFSAYFITSLYFDFYSKKSWELVKQFVTIMKRFQLEEENTYWLGYDIIPISSLPKNSEKVLCSCIKQDQTLLLDFATLIQDFITSTAFEACSVDTMAIEDLIKFIKTSGKAIEHVSLTKQLESCQKMEIEEDIEAYNYTNIGKNLLVVNGRVLTLNDVMLERDIMTLISLEKSNTRSITALLKEHDQTYESHQDLAKLIWRLSSFFAQLQGSKYSSFDSVVESTKIKRVNVDQVLKEVKERYIQQEENQETILPEQNPLELMWNDNKDKLNVRITAILDPLTEPTQRIAPILLTLRDELNLPFKLIFSPRIELNSEDELPVSSYYRFVASTTKHDPHATFRSLPTNHVFTIRMDVPEPWNVQQSVATQDTDNLRCFSLFDSENSNIASTRSKLFCGDYAFQLSNQLEEEDSSTEISYIYVEEDKMLNDMAVIEYQLSGLLFFGQCYDVKNNGMMDPPNGLQITLNRFASSMISKAVQDDSSDEVQKAEISSDGTISHVNENKSTGLQNDTKSYYSDTFVLKNLGYWQIHANPGIWEVNLEQHSKGTYEIIETEGNSKLLKPEELQNTVASKKLVMKDFVNRGELLLVKRRSSSQSLKIEKSSVSNADEEEVIHVFSLATGHLYERLLKIMMLSVTKRTSTRVKFWLFENFLSPSFKHSARYMASKIGCDVEFVTYKWPEWLRGQSVKQRIIWGYKILFLDVLFPLHVSKIIYVDADQVVRGDLKELWDMDLKGAPYGYVPFCTSREETLGYQFWQSGFWKSHLRNKPYHISALYVVDLDLFRRRLVGDKLRQTYQQLSADPNSLANLDQDLPNFAQHEVRIHSLPQEWLWCETWCSDETKPLAKTIDLCNNPEHKENKVSMAKRIISGELFEESWDELDVEVAAYYKAFLKSESGNEI